MSRKLDSKFHKLATDVIYDQKQYLKHRLELLNQQREEKSSKFF